MSKPCTIDDCDQPHCRRCGSHMLPCRTHDVCDGCELGLNDPTLIQQRLEYLRGELQAERISYDELHELQSLAVHIHPSDVELLEAAGVPERL